MLAHWGVRWSRGWSQQLREEHRFQCWQTITEGAVRLEPVVFLAPVADEHLDLEQNSRHYGGR
jgi:hypothetical protein